VSRPSASSRPRLARGCRLSQQTPATLLLPEGAMRLNPPGVKILERCDGHHTFDEIIRELRAEFVSAPAGAIEEDAGVFLERLQERRVVDYE
jgi:pyrroloquinoline quinone biosynthesis protein D